MSLLPIPHIQSLEVGLLGTAIGINDHQIRERQDFDFLFPLESNAEVMVVVACEKFIGGIYLIAHE